jgi:hypothetical protein
MINQQKLAQCVVCQLDQTVVPISQCANCQYMRSIETRSNYFIVSCGSDTDYIKHFSHTNKSHAVLPHKLTKQIRANHFYTTIHCYSCNRTRSFANIEDKTMSLTKLGQFIGNRLVENKCTESANIRIKNVVIFLSNKA